MQQAIEEGQELERLSNIIDTALKKTQPSRFFAWCARPSAFHKALLEYQNQVAQLSPVNIHQTYSTYGTYSEPASIAVNVDGGAINENTSLINNSGLESKETSTADTDYTNYLRSIIGYRNRSTGIQDLEKAARYLVSAAMQGHATAARVLKIMPGDPGVIFDSAQYQVTWFSMQLKSILPHQLLYSQAQWRLFLLEYSHRYQQGVYVDYEMRLNELEQALTYLNAYVRTIQDPVSTAAARAFLIEDVNETQPIRRSAWRILQKEIQGQDPLVDWYKQVFRTSSETEFAGSSDSIYPFRILPDSAVTDFYEKHQVSFTHSNRLNTIQRMDQQLEEVKANENGEYVLTVASHTQSKTIVFWDKTKQTEVGRAIKDGKRFVFYAYGDAIKLVIPESLSCLYYKIQNADGTLVMQAALPEETEYLEIQTQRLVFSKTCVYQPKICKIDAKTIDQQGIVKAGQLILNVVDTLSIHPNGCIEASQLYLTGGSIWNAGKIAATVKGMISLNYVFVHGAYSLTTLAQKEFGGAVLEGGDLSIISGAFVNLFSRTTARSSSLVTLVEMNMGLCVAVNMTKSRGIAIDLGVDVPHVMQKMRDITLFIKLCSTGEFTQALNTIDRFQFVANSMAVVRWCIRTFIPAAGQVTDMAWTTCMLAVSIPNLIQQAGALYQKSQQGRPIEPRDWYGVLALTGSISNQLYFLESQSEGLYAAHDTSMSDARGYWQWPSDETYALLTLNVLALFAPTQTDDAFLKIKSGLHVTGSLLDRSIVSAGMGHAAIALNISNLFYSSTQFVTAQWANNISESGHRLDRSHGFVRANNHFTDLAHQHTSNRMSVKRLLWQTQDYQDESTISANAATINSQQQGTHEGTLTVDSMVVVRGDELTFTEKSNIQGELIQIESKQLHHHGNLNGKQVQLAGDDIEDSGQIVADAVQYQTAATLTRLPAAVLKAKQVIIEGGDGNVTEQGKIHFSSVSSSDASEKINTHNSTALSIQARSILLETESEVNLNNQNGIINGTEHLDMRGQIISPEGILVLESQHTMSDASHIIAKEAYLSAAHKVERLATASLEAEKIDMGTSTSETMDHGKVILRPVNVSQTDDASLSVIRGNQVTLGDTYHLHADKSSVIVLAEENLDVSGMLAADTLGLSANATAVLTTSSVLTAGSLAVSANQIKSAGHTEAKAIHLKADDHIALEQTADMTAEKINVIASVIDQQSRMTISKSIDDPLSVVNETGKTVFASDLALEGSVQVTQSSTGQIIGEDAIVSLISPATVIDGGQMTVKAAFLSANRIERTASAITTAEHIQLGSSDHSTAEIIDQGHITQEDISFLNDTALQNSTTSLPPGLYAEAKDIKLGDTHVLDLQANAYFHADALLTMSGKAQHYAKAIHYKAPLAHIKGKVEADVIFYEVDQAIPETAQQALTRTGDFQEWQPKNALIVAVRQPQYLQGNFQLPYSINFTAPTLTVHGTFYSAHDISLTTTAGDFVVDQVSISAEEHLLLNINGNCHITNSQLQGNETQIIAANDIFNMHSTIQGYTFLNLDAEGNIENHCAESSYQGQFDTRMHYSPAQLLGGTGAGYQGTGLNIRAGGHFLLYSSNVISAGSNQILAMGKDTQTSTSPDVSDIEKQIAKINLMDQDQVGVSLQRWKTQLREQEKNRQPTIINEAAIKTTALNHRYKDFERHDSYVWGIHTSDHTTYDWDYQPSVIQSIAGNNIIQSQHGSIEATATNFTAPGQTSLIALGKDVVLRELILNGKSYRDSTVAGIFDSPSDTTNDNSCPTRIVSLAGVSIYALNDVRSEGAQIISLGKVELKAGHDVIVSAPILDHSTTTDGMSAAIQSQMCPAISILAAYNDGKALFTTPAFQSYQNGGTPTNSGQNTAATMANLWNLTIDSLNAYNGIMSGMLAGNPVSSIFPASSMVVAKVVFTYTHSETHWQTVDPSAGIFCASLDVEADNMVEFKNGVSVQVAGDAYIKGLSFVQEGARLEYSTEQDSLGISAGILASGDAVFGIQGSETSGQGVTYANQHFNVGGKLTVDANQLLMENANTQAEIVDIHVAQLVMKSDCSTYQSNGISFSADTASNVSAQQSQRDMSEISEITSIKAQTSTSIIGNADLTGARFIVTDKNETQVDHLTTHAVSEYNKGSTTGVCLNLQDFQGQGTRPFAQAIPSATVELGRGDFRAEQLSTFSGAAPQAGLDSSGDDGLHITHDSQYNISARVPLYNPEGIHQLEDNFHYAEDKLFAALQPQTTAVPAVEILPSHASHNSNSTSIDESKEIKTSRTITIERPTTNTSSSISHTRESVVTKAQQTLADTNKITHTPLTLTPPDRSAHSGQLSRFGMFGRMADRDNRLRVDRSAQAMQTHAERTQETKNETGEEVPTLMGGLKVGAAFLDRTSSIAKEQSGHYKEAAKHYVAEHEINKEPLQDRVKQFTNKIEQNFTNEAKRFSHLSIAAKIGAVGLGAAPEVMEVVQASPEERPKEGVLASAQFGVGEFAMRTCERVLAKAAIRYAPQSRFVSLALIPLAMAGCDAAGGHLAKEAAKTALNNISNDQRRPRSPNGG